MSRELIDALAVPVIQNMALWDRLYIAALTGLASGPAAARMVGHHGPRTTAVELTEAAELLASEAYHTRLRLLEVLQEEGPENA